MKTKLASRVDVMFRAFSDRTRLRILHMLRGGELCVCDIVAVLGVPQPKASRHLAYLRKAGLVMRASKACGAITAWRGRTAFHENGRHVHLGLASLLAWRLSQHQPRTFSIAVNDYGFELLSATPVDWSHELHADLFTPGHLLEDILASLNAGELALRRFREIARIAGLVFSGYPGAPKSARQLQASSGLFFQVFKQYDAGNLLLTQAEEEVLRQELDLARLEQTLQHINRLRLDLHLIKRPTPLAFPLLVERMRESLSSEKLADRIARMVRDLEKAAGPEPSP